MPAKNALKHYSENGYYHLYNRGVAKGPVFLDQQDYLVFMSFTKEYLSAPKIPTAEELLLMKTPYILKNYWHEITLLSFVLMPNHIHLLLKQKQSRSIESFMRSLFTRYVKYFNKKHDRVGHLFQDVYKGILVEKDEYLLWVSRYIHCNPQEIILPNQVLTNYSFSSYSTYLGLQNQTWVDPSDILAQFKNKKDYQNFVEDNEKEKDAPEMLSEFVLDSV